MMTLTAAAPVATLAVSADDRARTAAQFRTQTMCCGTANMRIVTSDRRVVKYAVATPAQIADMIAFVVVPAKGSPRVEGFAGGTGGCPCVMGTEGESIPAVCARWWALAAAAVAAEKIRAADPVAALRYELTRTDWNYEYTDDPGVWRAGRAQVDKVRAMALALPLAVRREVWPSLSWAPKCPLNAGETL
jgi:hypothetical protein